MKVVALLFCLLSAVYGLPANIKPNSARNIERLANLGPDELAEELSGQFEGDMVLNDELEAIFNSRNGRIPERYRWIENLVPYEIDTNRFHADQVIHIVEGLRSIEAVSCLKFVPYNPELHTDYISVVGDRSGCSSSVGRQSGRQEVNLQSYPVEQGCFRLGTIIHEFIHALGFRHMQSAAERDDYVEIVLANIQPGSENNFAKYTAEEVSLFNIPYDYGSVMHYSSTAFSVNGEKTIIALQETDQVMGQRLGMTTYDIGRINSMYCSN